MGCAPRSTRRQFLKTAPLAAAGLASSLASACRGLAPAPAGPPPEAAWKAKARSRLRLAVFADVYAGLPVEEAAERVAADGFSSVLFFNLRFADVECDLAKPDWAVAERIRGAFERRGIRIGALGGYHNPLHPNPVLRELGAARMRTLIANWKRLGSPTIATETGTLNPESEWLDSPENAGEDAYARCRAAFAEMARAAEKTGATVAIEPYWRNVIDSVDRAERLFRDVPSPALRLVMDPCNYFRKEDLPRMKPMLEEIFRRLAPWVVVAHAKDVRESPDGTDLPAAGLGALDYPLYLELLAGLDRDLDLAVEHLTLEDVPRALGFVRAAMGASA